MRVVKTNFSFSSLEPEIMSINYGIAYTNQAYFVKVDYTVYYSIFIHLLKMSYYISHCEGESHNDGGDGPLFKIKSGSQ